jgi:predicted phage terminase large subunit-like protein
MTKPKAADIFNSILRVDFPAFTEKVFNELNPTEVFFPNWSNQAISHQLGQCILGKTRRLIVLAPPRGLKSLQASVALPAFIHGHDPSAKIITISYGQDLAEKFCNQTRQIMKAPWFGELFTSTVISTTKDTQSHYETTANGERRATSIHGTLTGLGADYIIIDDPLKANDAYSEAAREGVNEWYKNTVPTRLNNPKEGRIILVQQRLHVADLPGQLIEQGNWDILRIPAIADQDLIFEIGNGKTYLFKQGELMHPARLGHAELKERQLALGSHGFSAQYLQDPIPPGGGLFKWEWFEHVDTHPEFSELIMSVDVAASAAGNYSAFTIWGHRNKIWYLIGAYRVRDQLPAVRKKLLELDKQYRPDIVVVDSNGVGAGLFQELRAQGHNHIHYANGEGKLKDANATLPMIEGGRVKIIASCPGLSDFRKELLAFPDGKYNDQVDSMVQLFKREGLALAKARQHKRAERKGVPCEYNMLKVTTKKIYSY